ncbi:FtsX-like permease family protein [Calidifontibacter indicus]|uniref:FtsX-like permease family protein n=1 Tax=Calidifontibacter indicus TaxID=419650 RepID=UPI003D71AE66
MTSWTVMLRLARRDLRRHAGRAMLTMALVALPTLVLAALATTVATASISETEHLSSRLGSAPGAVKVFANGTPDQHLFGVEQYAPTFDSGVTVGRPGALLDGARVADAETVGQLTGGTAYPLTIETTRVVVGDRRIRASVLGTDGRTPVYAGTATLTSGRWPRTADEVLVTDAGSSIGIPTRGSFVLHTDSRSDRKLTVVGAARTMDGHDLVTLPQSGATETSFLIDRAQPVSWADVQKWNTYGLLVLSRHLVEHPDLVPPAPPGFGAATDNRVPSNAIVLLLTGSVLLTVLVAGPAFTTSAARHRQALGQLASNGATRSMLRRYVLAQAVLLGVLSALVAVVLGALLGITITEVARRVSPRHAYGPVEVPWTQLLGLALVGVVSALVAAVFPAVSAARVNVVAVLRGHVSRPKVRVGWPILGAVLAVAGGALLWRTITASSLGGGEVPIAVGGVLLFGGAVVALPWLLVQVARLASVLPVAGRMATRDIGRQRSRATSGVAAVMAATALMTALAVGGGSDVAQAKRDYVPSAPAGEAFARSAPADLTRFAATARQLDPSLQIDEVRTTGALGWPDGRQPTERDVLYANAPSCPVPTSSVTDGAAGCASLGEGGMGTITVVEPAAAARMFNLSSTAQMWLNKGNVLAVQGDSGTVADGVRLKTIPDAVVRNGRLRFAWDRVPLEGAARPLAHTTTVPVRVLDASTPLLDSLRLSGIAVIVPTTLAARHGWNVPVSELRLHTSGGISTALEQRLRDRAPESVWFGVERGYQDRMMLIIEIMIASFALITLIVTLIGTALAQIEGRADQSTLAAIGAPRSIRRRMAAGYATAIGLVGGAVGFVVGLVPGIAVTWPLTTGTDASANTTGPVIAIPWAFLAPALIGVPLVAAIVAMAVTRSNPSVTRREAT